MFIGEILSELFTAFLIDLILINESVQEKMITKGQCHVSFLSAQDLIFIKLDINTPGLKEVSRKFRDFTNFIMINF